MGAEKAEVWGHQMSGLAKSMEESKIDTDPDWDESEQSENPGALPVMKKPALAEDTSMFTEDEMTVTHKLFKKGERLYREGSYTLWRDDQNDYYVAYAVDDRNSSIMDDVRASVRGGKESLADNTVNAKAQVLKIVATSEAKLEFDIYTQETVWKMRATRRAHFDEWIKFMSGRKPRKESELKCGTQCTIYTLTCDMTRPLRRLACSAPRAAYTSTTRPSITRVLSPRMAHVVSYLY